MKKVEDSGKMFDEHRCISVDLEGHNIIAYCFAIVLIIMIHMHISISVLTCNCISSYKMLFVTDNPIMFSLTNPYFKNDLFINL